MFDSGHDVGILVAAFDVDEEVYLSEVVLNVLRWLRNDPCHIYAIIGQNSDGFVKNTVRLSEGELKTSSVLGCPLRKIGVEHLLSSFSIHGKTCSLDSEQVCGFF